VAGDYNIKISAAIDSLEREPQDFADNMDTWNVSVTATPDVSLGPIGISPAQLTLRNMVEYTIPYSNDGNFAATNAILTIEKPDYTYLLYYIALGDLAPGLSNVIIAGVRIYSYKQLPGDLEPPLHLTLNSTLRHDLGEVSAFRSDDVSFNPAVADLILDKNIVAPTKFPLKITFTASDFGNVDIKIYNLAGEFIKLVYTGPVEKGDSYVYQWDGTNEQGNPVSSGVYFVYAVSRFYNGYKKVVIIR